MRLAIVVLLLTSLTGCAGMRQLAALNQVEFRFDRIAEPRIAGIRLADIHSPEDVSPIDMARLAIAIATKDVPLDLTVHVIGRNPETNKVTAKLIGLDWSYIVDGRETVAGSLAGGYEFPPGQPTDMPLQVGFNLVDFFGGNAGDLLEIALVLSGQRVSTHNVTMQLRPVIDTSIGPMRYPTPIELNLATVAR